MKSNHLLIILLFLFFSVSLHAQNDDEKEETEEELVVDSKAEARKPMDPLSPARAAFYSAVLPGLGQAYNKKYWKIPIVVGAITGGILVYDNRTKEYNRFRDAYKSRLAGNDTDEFWGTDDSGDALALPQFSNEALIRAQNTLRRERELALLITVGIYALNIIDANVDAHLLQYNVDDNLALKPHFKFNEMDATTNLGLTLNFNF